MLIHPNAWVRSTSRSRLAVMVLTGVQNHVSFTEYTFSFIEGIFEKRIRDYRSAFENRYSPSLAAGLSRKSERSRIYLRSVFMDL